ncbi:MAG: UDP-2,3-diacylglucosamine diphosphatase [Proteobacteria bacterium]|nr:UDP-2,3-diacylglucosamine diphosphatase [Pseudomonadota bacterium]
MQRTQNERTGVRPLKPLRYRTIWISDVHLGFRGCAADMLLDFLHSVECDTLYLVGDIIDIWELERRVYWPQAHNNVIRTLLGKAKTGTRIVYVPGNHDELLRDYCGMDFGNIEVRRNVMHETADGRKFLVMHGDEMDSVVKCSRFLAVIGSRAYDWLLWLNRYVNSARKLFGLPYWSLAAFLKHKVKNAVNFISSFEKGVAHEARRRGADGVVCGHIHRAEIRDIEGVLYCNDGDWVESCTALTEAFDGTLAIVDWSAKMNTGLHTTNASAAA